MAEESRVTESSRCVGATAYNRSGKAAHLHWLLGLTGRTLCSNNHAG